MPAQFVRDLLNCGQVELAAATELITTKKQSTILKFFAGSAFPASTAHTPLGSAYEYSKNIRGLSVGFPSTLLCEHLNLFTRQFLGVYCRC